MKTSKRAFLLPVVAAILLGACSTTPPRERELQALQAYQQVAGEPVSSIRFVRLHSWEPLGDRHLAIHTGPREVYLLTVDPCNELPWVQAITVSSSFSRVQAKFDHVQAREQRCRIRQIQPVDREELKKARAQLSGAT